jgi:type IV secretory pathway VirB4 component
MFNIKNKTEYKINERINLQSNVEKFEEDYKVEQMYDARDFKESKNTLSFNGLVCRTFVLEGTPKYLSSGEVSKTLSTLSKYKYSIKMLTVPEHMLPLRKKITFARSVYNALANVSGLFVNKSDIEVMQKLRDLDGFEEEMYNESTVSRMSLVLTIYAPNLEELDEIEKAMQPRLMIKRWNFVQPMFAHKEVFLDNLPVPTPIQKYGRVYTSNQLSTFMYGTTTPTMGTRDSGGHLLGISNITNNPYFFPFFKGDRVYNIIVTGKNGSGKSSLMKKLFEELNLYSLQRIVIDPEGEYSGVANFIGAKQIELNRVAGINPMYFNEEVIKVLNEEDKAHFNVKNDHILNLVSFFTLFPFVPSIHKENTQMILRSLTEFYDKATVSERYLEKYCDFLFDNKEKYDFADAFANFRKGMPYGGFFNSTEALSMEEEAIVFNLKGVEDPHVKLAMMYIIMTQVKDKMLLNNIKPVEDSKVVTTFVDEFHLFLKDPAVRDRFIEIAKRNRKYNCNFILSTQEIYDFERYGAESLIEQSGYNIVYRQDERCQNLLKLKREEVNILARMPVGSCFIIDPNGIDGKVNNVAVYLKPHQLDYVSKINSVT